MNNTLQKATLMINPDYKVILEFGVSVGTSTSFLRSTFSNEYKIYGFDSFVGLPENWIDNGCDMGHKGDFSTNGNPPNISGVVFYKGWFEETIPQYIKEHTDPIGLIHIDCDLYSSTKTVLEGINPYIVKDTIISFDEWAAAKEDGWHFDCEQKAFYEWAMNHDRAFEVMPIINKKWADEPKYSNEWADRGRRIVKITN